MPNFFVIGAMKAGTTSLWHALRAHPDIYMSPEKEPHYFTYVGQPVDPVYPRRPRTLHDYLELFDGVNGQSAIGDKHSPSYFDVKVVPSRIHRRPPGRPIHRNPAQSCRSCLFFVCVSTVAGIRDSFELCGGRASRACGSTLTETPRSGVISQEGCMARTS